MTGRTEHLAQGAVIALMLCWLAWHLALPIDFIRADLGRHIKNGELILQGNWDVLYKNYYTYTNPQYPFINHHWLFGVFCYLLWHAFGFTGLSFIYLILELLTFYIFFHCGRKYSSFLLACGFALLSFPLVSFRSEVRPEGVSYFFCGLFWWMLDAFQHKRLKPQVLFPVLCVIQIIWVNTHIFFIMGPILTALFWWQQRSNGQEPEARLLQKLFFLLSGMCLVNPSGIRAFLPFLDISRAYSYWILEERTIFYFLTAAFMPWKSFVLYFLFTMVLLGGALFTLARREGFRKYIVMGSLTVLLSFAAMKAIRLTGLYGFFWIPFSMIAYSRLLEGQTAGVRKKVEMGILILGIIVSSCVNFDWRNKPFLGIAPGSNDAAQFFKQEEIPGPVFNNYDIGGYLIFHLAPTYKLFVDDREEAFPKGFFLNTYVPMQLNDDLWKKMEAQWRFNVIFFSLDVTPWGSEFIKERFADPSWAVVYYTDKAIIFLKRNAQNAGIIRRHEIKVVYVQA